MSILSWMDSCIVVVYISAMVVFGIWFYRRSQTLDGFVLGNRQLPGWALGTSILATYLSSISFLANPGKSYADNWSPFVFSLTIPISAWMASRWFIPMYREFLHHSAYEHLERRFGYWARAYSALALIMLQIGRIAVVLYLISLAMSSFLGMNIVFLIVVLGLATILYAAIGGIEAVVWTDVVQAFVLIFGGVFCLVLILVNLPSGLNAGFDFAQNHGKFSLGDSSFTLLTDSLWVIFVFGLVENLRNFAVDQNYVQRFLAAKSTADARKSLWIGALTYIPLSALFFLIGTALFVYYGMLPAADIDLPTANDQIFPYFIVTQLPVGVKGLIIAAILAAGMSTLDSSINVSSTVFLTDFYKRLINPLATPIQLLRVVRITTVVMGLAGIGAALLMLSVKTILDVWWQISAVFGGGMLGLFLLGVLVPKANSRAAVAGVVAGLLLVAWASFASDLPAQWAVFNFPLHKLMAGFASTLAIVGVGWLFSLNVHKRNSAVLSKNQQ